MKHAALISAAALAASTAMAGRASAQASDMYLGQLMLVPYTFCPNGWAEANGQILAISTNTALFSLLGATYGGNGQTNFALPDLRGRVPVHVGQAAGLPTVTLGQVFGAPSTILTVTNLPAHTHALYASTGTPDTPDPSGAALATFNAGTNVYSQAGVPTKPMKPGSIGPSGGSAPFRPAPALAGAALVHRAHRRLSAAALRSAQRAASRFWPSK